MTSILENHESQPQLAQYLALKAYKGFCQARLAKARKIRWQLEPEVRVSMQA